MNKIKTTVKDTKSNLNPNIPGIVDTIEEIETIDSFNETNNGTDDDLGFLKRLGSSHLSQLNSTIHNQPENRKYVLYSENNFEGIAHNYGNFKNGDFSDIEIIASELKYSNFLRSRMDGAHIVRTDLYGANFKQSSFKDAQISNSNFCFSSFENANLNGTNIRNSDFRWANFKGANLSLCSFKSTKLRGSIFDQHTLLPFDHNKALSFGMVFAFYEQNAS